MTHDEMVQVVRRAMLETQAATGAACGCDTGTAPYVNEFDAILERAEEALYSPYRAGWNAAVAASCGKAMTIQTGFRNLLKGARERLQVLLNRAADSSGRQDGHQDAELKATIAAIDQGEAIVGTLGDVIRNIAAMKGQCPP